MQDPTLRPVPVPGCAIVVLSDRLGAVLPAAAVPLLREAEAVYVASDVDDALRAAMGAAPAPTPSALVAEAGERPVLLVAADAADPAAAALHAAGAPVLGTPEPVGAALLDAVAAMDRLRSPGGCPWDAEQTHESLRQYLIEETYELLEAIEDGDRAALREELGDVLLQVLFHSRVASEDPADPFSVDDVAGDLVAKLVGRHPHVFADGDPHVHDATSQQHRWEELKQAEKRRESSLDGVATGQPAVALAAKLAQRTARAGLPADLLPEGDSSGELLFVVAALAKLAGEDPEGELRAVARRFAERVREAERSARAAGVDPATMGPTGWRRFWPASS
ncbi:XTP/dITP diphosphohydrolase [Streptoalloteichus tenebrarius]|uniref:XTP/dITP diphosphohydrolase n=1 Tax=Streptoalloteichus tenebrarius (strain ATCC 17920 / DSM 40477 / JCM 4838 / CBS 697.72 / NBRC 16177 / NCIMB 11028 / NRRL B-12390 / A12253. 1 / ISP 5477) TaxID=1933 RepID=A0ABT1HU96_STRSD|nr:MazG family protein [Streptoalloteichus tenebrarius]MCP2258995.1 XTP/dITP diphosphohydrolase [Streptoalloteichus tenebrarius]BFF01205.1 MazG family protein [Streptoalloteichus tenebrarius]